MINEILFILLFLLNSALIYSTSKMGHRYFIAFFIVLLVLSELFAGVLISTVGITIGVSILFYPHAFVMINMVNEVRGKLHAKEFANIGLFVLVTLLILIFLSSHFSSTPDTPAVSATLDAVLSSTTRVIIASIIAYGVSQGICVWLYDYLKEKFQEKGIWFRNVVSGFVAQGFDSLVFFPLAFYTIVPLKVLIVITITGWLVKSFIMLAITPVIYLNKNEHVT